MLQVPYLQQLPLETSSSPLVFLIDLNLSGFALRIGGLLFRLDATLSIETSSTCSTRSAIFVSSQNYPMYIKQRTSCFRDFRERNAVFYMVSGAGKMAARHVYPAL